MTLTYVRPAWSHQKAAIERAGDLPQFGLFFDPGTGKTGTVINMLRDKMNRHKRFLRTLVISPGVTLANWKDEFKLNSKIPPAQIHILQGSGARRVKDFKKFAYKDGQRDQKIFITNYESLLMEELFNAFFDWQPECFVFDESHSIKSIKAKRSKRAAILANPWCKETRSIRKPLFKSILTGTPLLNSPLDLFQQFLVLDGGATFTDNYYRFRARFFANRNAHIPKREGVFIPEKWELKTLELDGFDAAAEFKHLLGRYVATAVKSECMDLPPLVSTYRKIAMTPDQARMYKEMKRDFITYVNSNALEKFEGDEPPEGAVVAKLAVTKLMRLMQIASSYCKTDTGKEFSIKDTPKAGALRELLEEIAPAHKVLVWSTWKSNYAQIRSVCEELNLKYVEVHGEIPNAKKQDNVRNFESDDSIRVLIGHPGSGGIGVNLCAASYSIYYSLGYSLGHYIQSRDRNHRGGSERHDKITHIHLVCEGTVDEVVREKLIEKQALSDKILVDISRYLEVDSEGT